MASPMESLESLHISKPMLIVAFITFLLIGLQRYLSVQRDPREPPFVYSKVPIFGHAFQLFRHGADYFTTIQRQYGYGMYTLPVFRGRFYIAASPEWATAIQRSHKTIYFNTLIAQAMQSLFCLDEPAMAIINHNLNGEEGDRDGIILGMHDLMLSTLAPGESLDELNKNILNAIAPDVNQLAKGEASNVKLWEWLRHHFSIASVAAIWGPRNPFSKYPDVEAAFWEFEANAMPLSMMPYPSIFARKGHKARQKVLDAFEEYVENEAYNDPETSLLIKYRKKLNVDRFGLSKKMYAYADASLLLGALLNTIPAAFWLIGWIFEDEQLLKEIRHEIDECVTISGADKKKGIIDAPKLRSDCPLFVSTLRETLRLSGSLNSNRYVAEDTVLTNSAGESVLLKKGSVVQIAGNVIHFKSFWGSDADSFNPRRFMPKSEKAKSEAGKPQDPAAPFRDSNGKLHSSAFRSFGGGNNICPGRFFAQTEILGLASLFIAGFEVENVTGSGPYKMPPYEDFKLLMSVLKPKEDVDVRIRRRKGYEEVDWAFDI